MRQNKDKRIIPLIKRDQRYSPFFFVPEQRRGEKPLLVKMCARIFTATGSRGEAPCQVEDEIPPRPMSFRHMVLGIFCRPNLTDVRQGTVPTSPAKKSKQKGTNTMTRVSRHNGRSGSHGTYNSTHNDREFDLQNAEDIKAELTENNLYWNCVDQQLIRHGELKAASTSIGFGASQSKESAYAKPFDYDTLREHGLTEEFCGRINKIITLNNLDEWIKTDAYITCLRRLLTSLGFSITNNHAFRMSLNSIVLAGKLNLPVAKRAELLGHSVETNMMYYTYATKDDMDDLVDLFNDNGEVSPRSHLKIVNFEKEKSLETANFKAL